MHVGDAARWHVRGMRDDLALHHRAHGHTEPECVALHCELPLALRLVPAFQAVLQGVAGASGGLVVQAPQAMAHRIVHAMLGMQGRCLGMHMCRLRRRHNRQRGRGTSSTRHEVAERCSDASAPGDQPRGSKPATAAPSFFCDRWASAAQAQKRRRARHRRRTRPRVLQRRRAQTSEHARLSQRPSSRMSLPPSRPARCLSPPATRRQMPRRARLS